MSNQPPPAEATRKRVLFAAMQLFAAKGYQSTSIADILQAAHAHAGSLYHFFQGKDQLLLQVLEFALSYLSPAVMDPVERQTSDPLERVFTLLNQYRAGMLRHGCRMGCPIGNLALEVSDGNPAARALIHQNFENWTRRVEGWLIAAGDRLPVNLDRAQLAHFILTVMEGGLMQARAADSLAPFDQSVAVLRHYMDLLQQHAQASKPKKVRTRRNS